MMKKILPIFLSALLLQACGKLAKCDKGGRVDLLFELPVTITPAKDTFRVGDTIWIESVFSDNIINRNTGKTYRVENFNFNTTLGIIDINAPAPAYSYKNPRFITYEGSTTGNNIAEAKYLAIYIDYAYKEGMYKYKAAFIADKTGCYTTTFSSASDVLSSDDISGCPNENLTINYIVNNSEDNNYSLLKNALDPHYSGLGVNQFHEQGGYCFCIIP